MSSRPFPGCTAGAAALALGIFLSSAARAQATGAPAAKPPSVIFTNVRVFDGKGASPSGPTHVLVTGNLITRIGRDGVQAEPGSALSIIDGGGRTLMPGLIDAHAHLSFYNLPLAGATVDTKGESWYLGFNFQQHLWQIPTDRTEGWGLFGQAFLTDGNPNLYRWFFNLGLAGTSPIPGRHLDRAGVGVFDLCPSGDLTDSLKSIYGVTVGQERGVEAFYNAAVVPWFRVALDLQYIRPGVRGNDNAFFAGLSAQVKL